MPHVCRYKIKPQDLYPQTQSPIVARACGFGIPRSSYSAASAVTVPLKIITLKWPCRSLVHGQLAVGTMLLVGLKAICQWLNCKQWIWFYLSLPSDLNIQGHCTASVSYIQGVHIYIKQLFSDQTVTVISRPYLCTNVILVKGKSYPFWPRCYYCVLLWQMLSYTICTLLWIFNHVVQLED